MRYFDIAVNLVGSSIESDADNIIAMAKQVGVSPLMVIASHLDESERAIAFCQDYPELLYCTVGVHPHHSSKWQQDSPIKLKGLCQSPLVKAVGECGLDYNRDYSPRDKQRQAFSEQLALACELQLPVLMHQRDSHNDFMAILKEYRSSLPKALLHCFTGNQAELEAYLELDLHIGVTGWVCDERRGQDLANSVNLIPDNRILIETDSPYLLPRSMRPKPKSNKNLPQYLPYIAEFIAKLRQQNVAEFAQHCYQNSLSYFNIDNKVS